MEQLVAISFQGTVEHHIPAVNDDGYFATLCGLSGEGDDQELTDSTKLTVECPQCIAIWEKCKQLTMIKGKVRIKPVKRFLGDKPASIKAKTGWLLPSGKFYACNTFQHEALAEALGKPSRQAENTWIRIVHPSDSNLPAMLISPFSLIGLDKPPTQKQLNFMWDWCIHHHMPFPKEELELL